MNSYKSSRIRQEVKKENHNRVVSLNVIKKSPFSTQMFSAKKK